MKKGQKSRVLFQLSSSKQTIDIIPNLEYTHVQIEELAIPHIWLPNLAGSFIFTDSLGIVSTVPFPATNPDILTSLINLVNLFNSLDTGGATYSYFLNTITFTFQIVTNSTDFGFVVTKNSGQRLGLTTPSITHPGYYGKDFGSGNTLQSLKFNFATMQLLIDFSIRIIGQGTSFDNLTKELSSPALNTQRSNYLVCFPVNSSPGCIENYYLGDWGIVYDLSQGFQSLTITITDEYGNPIDVSPQYMYLTLVYSC